jgi:Holliday junction resolvase RusA-like endonuclease
MKLGEVIEFTVQGDPVPQGSMKAFVPKGWQRAVITTANPKLKAWRQKVRSAALNAMGFSSPAGKRVPIRVSVTFYFTRARTNRDTDKITAPDIDKLCRGVFDALTGVCYDDDAQITEIHAAKFYGQARVEIRVEEVLPATKPLNFCAGTVEVIGKPF